jgi:hypothetical protein
MTIFLIWLLIGQCIAMAVWGLIKRERMIQFPFLVAIVFLGWVIPQLFGLTSDYLLPEGALAKTVMMSIFCAGAAYFGYRANTRPARLFKWRFSYKRLLSGSILLSLIGSYFFYQMSRLAPEAGMQWSGIITVYLFLSELMTFGFVIAVLLHIRHQSWVTLAIIIFNCLLYVERIVIAGRRAAMIEFGMIILLGLWFKWRWVPPRLVVVGGLLLGVLLVNSMTEYRMSTSQAGIFQTDWSTILSIDYVGNLKSLTEEGGHELRNAAYGIEAVDQTLSFNYGASLWNTFVFRYVPAQFVGVDLKNSLMIELEDSASKVFGYKPLTGITQTGIQTAFQSFWFFGAFIFAIIGWIMSRWYLAATQGNFVAQILAMLMPGPALHAITHHHDIFFLPFVQWAVFLLPALMLAQDKGGSVIIKTPGRVVDRIC